MLSQATHSLVPWHWITLITLWPHPGLRASRLPVSSSVVHKFCWLMTLNYSAINSCDVRWKRKMQLFSNIHRWEADWHYHSFDKIRDAKPQNSISCLRWCFKNAYKSYFQNSLSFYFSKYVAQLKEHSIPVLIYVLEAKYYYCLNALCLLNSLTISSSWTTHHLDTHNYFRLHIFSRKKTMCNKHKEESYSASQKYPTPAPCSCILIGKKGMVFSEVKFCDRKHLVNPSRCAKPAERIVTQNPATRPRTAIQRECIGTPLS